MIMIKQIKHFLKYLKLVMKINRKLPKYNTLTGQHFYWEVQLGYYLIHAYNSKTGIAFKRILVPKVNVTQLPIGVHTGQKCYRYNIAKKQVEEIPHARFE